MFITSNGVLRIFNHLLVLGYVDIHLTQLFLHGAAEVYELLKLLLLLLLHFLNMILFIFYFDLIGENIGFVSYPGWSLRLIIMSLS